MKIRQARKILNAAYPTITKYRKDTWKKSGYCVLDYGCDQLEGIKCNKGFTRTEAIERMAKAMAADDMPVEGYKVLAEAALDALLK